MITHSNAYRTWRVHSQQMLDFAVMVCTAAPQLSDSLKKYEANPTFPIAKNSNFQPSQDAYSTEMRALTRYEGVLGASLLLSLFSHFETYFFSVLDEIIEFHGGFEEMQTTIERRNKEANLTSSQQGALKKISTWFQGGRDLRYRDASRVVEESKFFWPSGHFMMFGLQAFKDQRKRWKARDIPRLSETFLHYQFTESELGKFQNLRQARNGIAHGTDLEYDLEKAVTESKYFLEMGKKIDKHIVESLFIIERGAHY
jgi:hypothetical protein